MMLVVPLPLLGAVALALSAAAASDNETTSNELDRVDTNDEFTKILIGSTPGGQKGSVLAVGTLKPPTHSKRPSPVLTSGSRNVSKSGGYDKTEGFFDAGLSPRTVASVPFSGGYLSVWEHLLVKGRYYVQPLVYFKSDSAAVRTNFLTGENEMLFSVIMWSEEAHEAVYDYLRKEINRTARRSQILPLPTEKVKITWKSDKPISTKFDLADHWQANTHRPVELRFKFHCANKSDCESLALTMNSDPTLFDGLELQYIMRARAAARKDIFIRTEHITAGKLFARIRNTINTDEVYLNSNDVKELAAECASNVIIRTITDAEYVDSNNEVKVREIVLMALQNEQTSSEDFQPQMWESVFWDKDWARPDKLTDELNELFTYDNRDTDHIYFKDVTDNSRLSQTAIAAFRRIFSSSIRIQSHTQSNQKRYRVSQRAVVNHLSKFYNNVQWSGEKFVVKPMILYRLNMAALRQSTQFVSTSIQVKKYEAVHSIRVKLDDVANIASSGLTPDLVQTRLRNELQALKSRMDMYLADVWQKFSNQGNQMNAAMDAVSINLSTLGKTTWNNITTLDTTLRKVWPPGNYCVWKNSHGRCPGGFTIKGSDEIKLDGWRGVSTGKCSHGDNFFGTSKIRRWTDCERRLYLVVCCK